MKGKKLIALILTAILCFSLSAEALAQNPIQISVSAEDDDEAESARLPSCVESIESFESVSVPFYNYLPEPESFPFELWFLNGDRSVPYISMEYLALIFYLNAIPMTVETPADDSYQFIRESGASMTLDFENETISFSDIDEFTERTSAVNGLDIVNNTTNGADGQMMIGHSSVFYRSAKEITISLKDYGIPMIFREGMGYVPLQTVQDLVLSRMLRFAVYNGQALFLAWNLNTTPSDDDGSSSDAAQTIGDLFYSAPVAEKSDMLTIFNYNELCLALDYSYGLQQEHGITSFHRFFRQTGLADSLRSSNALDTYRALSTLTNGYFADEHSMTQALSYLAMADDESDSTRSEAEDQAAYDYSMNSYLNCQDVYTAYRAAAYPDGCPGYEEVDDTAYISFDEFSMHNNNDYYASAPTANSRDTLELIMYANEQIHREGSPIHNVVIDLTLNGGGDTDAGACVIAWMLGSSSVFAEDPISGAQGVTSYTFDANRDGEMDENDSLGTLNYKLYCLISPVSFSCGNLVAAALSANHFVTLIGDSSTGGACLTEEMITADGTRFRISGPTRLSTMNNGVYFSVDQGVDPDIFIDKPEHLYDRDYLTYMIHSLA